MNRNPAFQSRLGSAHPTSKNTSISHGLKLSPRLHRMFEALYGNARIPVPPRSQPVNHFADDLQAQHFLRDFIELRGPSEAPPVDTRRRIPGMYFADDASDKAATSLQSTLSAAQARDPLTLELVCNLVESERFMRMSINSLQHIKDVASDASLNDLPSQFALDWVEHALNLAQDIRRLFYENAPLNEAIIFQRITIPGALARFLRLLSLIHASYKLWAKKPHPGAIWILPSMAEPVYEGDWMMDIQSLDLYEELKQIQALLKRQSKAADNKRLKNFKRALVIVDAAHQYGTQTLVIHLCLEYLTGATLPLLNMKDEIIVPEPKVNLDVFRSHLAAFLRQLDKKVLKLDLRGYLLKLEYGLQKGHHAHLLLFVKEANHKDEMSLIQLLSDLWIAQITQSDGHAWSFNTNTGHSYKAATGLLHQKDEKKILQMEIFLKYLIKYNLPFDYLPQLKFQRFRSSSRK